MESGPRLSSSSIRKREWLLLGGLILILYRGVLPSWGLVLWNDPNYSHGLLIPLIAIYLFRVRLQAMTVEAGRSQPGWSALPLVLAALAMLLAGQIGAEFFLKRTSLVVLLFAALALLEGWRFAKAMSLPVGLLFFAVPLPYVFYNSLAFPLKLLASRLAVKILTLTGMPVYQEGNIIVTPHSTLEVVDACSGIRSLMTLITLAVLLAFFHHQERWKRLLVLALAVPVAVMANAMRVAATGILTQYNPGWGHGPLHEFAGWLIFMAALAGLWLCSQLLRGGGIAGGTHSGHWGLDGAELTPPVLAPEKATTPPTPVAPLKIGKPFLLLSGLILAATVYLHFGGTVRPVPLARPLSDFPRVIGAFTQTSSHTFDEAAIKVAGMDEYLMWQYRDDQGYTLGLYIGYYKDQVEGGIIHSPKHCLPGSGWEPSEMREVIVPGWNGVNYPISRMVLRKGTETQIAHYWFQGRGRVLASEYQDRALMVWDSLTRGRSDGALLRITGPGGNEEVDTKKQMEFIRDLLPVIANFLPQ